MALTFYSGSGSPYAWRVQLALECKALPYTLNMLSFSAGDTRKPEFVALNPRHRVPVLVDDGFVLYESNAIVEYLDEAYPGRGAPLFPGDAQQRAVVRRMIAESDEYLTEALDPISEQAFSRKPEERDAVVLATAVAALRDEYAQWSQYLRGDFLAGPLSAADFSLYPRIAVLARFALRLPDFDGDALLTPALLKWRSRMQALPYLDKTVPPHWKAA